MLAFKNGFVLKRRRFFLSIIINKPCDFNGNIASQSHFDAEVIGRCGEQSHCASGEIFNGSSRKQTDLQEPGRCSHSTYRETEEEIQVSNQREMVSNIHCLIVSIKLPSVLVVLRNK